LAGRNLGWSPFKINPFKRRRRRKTTTIWIDTARIEGKKSSRSRALEKNEDEAFSSLQDGAAIGPLQVFSLAYLYLSRGLENQKINGGKEGRATREKKRRELLCLPVGASRRSLKPFCFFLFCFSVKINYSFFSTLFPYQ
jgi:hypothetical protein